MRNAGFLILVLVLFTVGSIAGLGSMQPPVYEVSDDDDHITVFNYPLEQYVYETKKGKVHDEHTYLHWDEDLGLNEESVRTQLEQELSDMVLKLRHQRLEIEKRKYMPDSNLRRYVVLEDDLRRMEEQLRLIDTGRYIGRSGKLHNFHE
jgi:hypothetical protein